MNHTHRTHAYALSVTQGYQVAGPDICSACQRHLDDLKNADSKGIYFCEDSAERVFRFFENVLKLSGGRFEDQPFKLLDWQAFILGSLFGWKFKTDDSRRFRKAYVETGKGSGKSPLSAGIGLYGLIADAEGSAEIYAAASKKDQAQVLYRDAVSMVRQAPSLSNAILLSGRNPVWNMTYKASSFFRPISSDSGQSGPRPHIALIDELHEHKDDQIVEMMVAGTKGRYQPLIFMITNSGHDRTSVCFQYHEYAKKIAAQDLEDDRFFSFICSLDDGDDPFKDESCWAKANPSLGKTIPIEYLREQVAQARGMPAKESIVRRLNFCQWVDAADPWIGSDRFHAVWKDFPHEELYGEVCYAGLDLSGTRDLTALALYFPVQQKMFIEYWTPLDTLDERAKQYHVPYRAWKDNGWLHAMDGTSIDYRDVALRLLELSQLYDIRAVAFDKYRISHLTPFLEEVGCTIELVEHGQGYGKSIASGLWMPRSIEILEKDILEEQITFQASPVTRWNAASAVATADRQDNRILDKAKSTGKIDGMVAAAMARGCAEVSHKPEKKITWGLIV